MYFNDLKNKKGVYLAFASLAVAFAIIVLPHPGGPYNKTPLGGWKKWDFCFKIGYVKSGKIIFDLIEFTISSKPAISSKVTSISEGSTNCEAIESSYSFKVEIIFSKPRDDNKVVAYNINCTTASDKVVEINF